MAIQNSNPASIIETHGSKVSRRHACAMMLGVGSWLPGVLAAADTGAPVRLAISESIMGDVNLNDAKSAMQIWVNRMTSDLSIAIGRDSKLVYTSREILDGVRKGELDAVAINIIEYRQIADLLDSSQIVCVAGAAGLEQYVILAKKSGPIQHLADLKGRRLCTLNVPKMCVAPAWLSTLLEAGHLGAAEQFFGSVITDTKASRVVLPVFFGQADACLTSKRSFDTMCELNPQVRDQLRVLATSPRLVPAVGFIRRGYDSPLRDTLLAALRGLEKSAAGAQVLTLFQSDELREAPASLLESARDLIEAHRHLTVPAAGKPSDPKPLTPIATGEQVP